MALVVTGDLILWISHLPLYHIVCEIFRKFYVCGYINPASHGYRINQYGFLLNKDT